MAWSVMVTAGLWVTCLGLLLESVGFAIPFWFGYETAATAATNDKTLQTYVGSWYVMSCVKGEASSCKSEAIEPNFDGATDNVTSIGLSFASTSQELIATTTAAALANSKYWIAVIIASTISLGLCLLAGLVLICCRCAGIHSQKMFALAAFVLLFGAIGVIGTASYSTWLVADKFDFLQSINAAKFPWSILLFGIGGICALLASLILFVIVCQWPKYGKYRASDEDSYVDDDVPMSDVSKSRRERERGFDNPRFADYPREPYDVKRSYPERNGYSHRESRKYDDYIRDRTYDNYDRKRDYDREYREYNRHDYDDRHYNEGYHSKDRGYDRGYDRDYERDRERAYDGYDRDRRGHSYERDYAMSRKDNMYRPYKY